MIKETEQFLSRDGKTQIHAVRYLPEGKVRGIVQICHGMCEYIEQYEWLAGQLTKVGFVVVGNDHLGHGASVVDEDAYGFFGQPNGNENVLADMRALQLATMEAYPGLPYVFLGFSMGSFFVRQYMTLFGKSITAVILMGAGDPSSTSLARGSFIARIVARARGWHYRSASLERMVFGPYVKSLPNARTHLDWMCKNEDFIDQKLQDPKSAFRFTLNGFYELFRAIRWTKNRKYLIKMPQTIPILLVSGAEDPVGENGLALGRIAAVYKKRGMTNVDIKLYPGMRHVILQEEGREEVAKDLREWIVKNTRAEVRSAYVKPFSKMIEDELADAFKEAGFDPSYARVKISDRPDLCEYQCNGAMAAAKQYEKPPREIAEAVCAKLAKHALFSEVGLAGPGFINLRIDTWVLASRMSEMAGDGSLLLHATEEPRTIIVDYGGPNVAKPLHVGHLRSAIIGESIKRMGRRMGHEMIGDIHLGDWGLQIGLIIAGLKDKQPDLPYFAPDAKGPFPKEPPFTISELEEIYPAASARSKEDEAFYQEALAATHALQEGKPGYLALWEHVLSVSVADLKENYRKLDVSFELWKKESDAQPYIADMVQKMKDDGFAYEDQGALIVDVAREDDTKEVPPCIILKSDGASLYTTTDLATIIDRMKTIGPDEMLYVVDKRQEMHFRQVFRCARKTGLVPDDVELRFLGFGTMNGKDGKPFKTREGGIMRLETLIADINQQMYEKIIENRDTRGEDAEHTAEIVGLSAIKYGDLSNQASKDYVFDIDRFTSFEGNTGPYILYTIVRIKSILARYKESGGRSGNVFLNAGTRAEKDLMLQLARYPEAFADAWNERAPHRLCAYIYELANLVNTFYHATRILAEEDARQKQSYINLIALCARVLEDAIWALGFSAPERM